jgi:hypothetical protein
MSSPSIELSASRTVPIIEMDDTSLLSNGLSSDVALRSSHSTVIVALESFLDLAIMNCEHELVKGEAGDGVIR